MTDFSSNKVSAVNTATDAVVKTIGVGGSPGGVAITPNSTYAYVTDFGSNSVSVINTPTNTVVKTISVGSSPAGVAIT